MYTETPTRFVDIIKVCEATGQRKPKLDALKTADEGAKRLIAEALNPYRVYGVKKFDEPLCYDVKDAPVQVFVDLLDQLCTNLSGNAARDAVQDVLGQYTKETATYLKRIIAKDLRAGFSADTFNKIYNMVPSFNIMLASKVDDSYEWEFPCIADVKYDGTRLIAICENGTVKYFSRNGKEAEFAYGVYDDELRQIEKVVGVPIVLDGEALASSFTETLNAKSRGNTEARKNLRYFVFDLLTLDEWVKQECTRTQYDRHILLQSTLEAVPSLTRITRSNYKICKDYAEVYEFFKDVIANNPKGQDEGLIIKKMGGFYEWDRSLNWAKKKPVYDYDLQIIGFYEGRGRNEGTLGGITVQGYDENGHFITTNVGSGFSDAMRNEIWNNRDKYLGKIVLIEAQELSQNATDLTKYSLRFPVFVRVRDDK